MVEVPLLGLVCGIVIVGVIGVCFGVLIIALCKMAR